MVHLSSAVLKMVKWPVVPSSGGGYLKPRHKVIRLALKGCANRPFYHVVVSNHWRDRDAPPFEQVGTYDPMANEENQRLLSLNLERIRYWIGRGTYFSKPVSELLGRIGFLPINPQTVEWSWKLRRAAREKLAAEEAKAKESSESAPAES